MADTKTKLEELQTKKKQLEARIARIQKRETESQRKADMRRKLLIGAYHLQQEKGDFRQFCLAMDGYLVRDIDRALFGLPHLTEAEKQQRSKKGD